MPLNTCQVCGKKWDSPQAASLCLACKKKIERLEKSQEIEARKAPAESGLEPPSSKIEGARTEAEQTLREFIESGAPSFVVEETDSSQATFYMAARELAVRHNLPVQITVIEASGGGAGGIYLRRSSIEAALQVNKGVPAKAAPTVGALGERLLRTDGATSKSREEATDLLREFIQSEDTAWVVSEIESRPNTFFQQAKDVAARSRLPVAVTKSGDTIYFKRKGVK